MKKLLSFGEIIFDICDGEATLGGAPLNLALHTAKFGLPSYILSAVGNDRLGDTAIEQISALGVGCELIERNSYPTGFCTVRLDKEGVPSYEIAEGVAYGKIEPRPESFQKIDEISPDILYFGTLIQKDEVSRNTLDLLINNYKFEQIVCDINLRKNCYTKETVERCLSLASILKLSDGEVLELISLGIIPPEASACEALLSHLFESYPSIRLIILTKGEDGSVIATSGGKRYTFPAVRREVVSTVGAGDAYLGAFLAVYLSGAPIDRAGAVASEVAGFTVSRKEAVPHYTVSGGEPCFPS
ncbi:MAG: carbohydrate kinase [Clostridia bacterium]|nr:carbohydrate kinase [Clostridia bacterium]